MIQNIKESVCKWLIAMSITTFAVSCLAQGSSWQALIPGVANVAGFTDTAPYGNWAVATNGTLYSLFAGEVDGNFGLWQWNILSGWVQIAGFNSLFSPCGAGAVYMAEDTIYIGGNFTSASTGVSGTINVTNIAAYDTVSGRISSVGNNSSEFSSLLVDTICEDSGQNLYIGLYPGGGDVPPTNMVMFLKGQTWQPVGKGFITYFAYGAGRGGMRGLAADSSGNVYAAGYFLGATNSNGIKVQSTNIIRVSGLDDSVFVNVGNGGMWAGSTDESFGTEDIYSLAVSGTNVFLAGAFHSLPDVVLFNTSSRLYIPALSYTFSEATSDGGAFQLSVEGNVVYVAGAFDTIGSASINSIAWWDRTNNDWNSLGSGLQNDDGSAGTTGTMAADKDAVYVFGNQSLEGSSFTFAGGVRCDDGPIARYVTDATEPQMSIIDWWPGVTNSSIGSDVKDIIGPYSGTNQGGVTFSSTNMVFNGGSTSYVNLGTNAGNFGTNNFEIDFYIKTTAANVQALMGKRPSCGDDNLWGSRMNAAGKINFEICQNIGGTDYTRLLSAVVINDGHFHAIAIIRQGVDYYMYVDGSLNDSESSASVVNIANHADLEFGNDVCVGSPDGTERFNGDLNQIKFYEQCAE